MRLRVATNHVLREVVRDRSLAELPELAALEVRTADVAAVERLRRVRRVHEGAETANVLFLRLLGRRDAVGFRAVGGGAEDGGRPPAGLAMAELVRAVEDHAVTATVDLRVERQVLEQRHRARKRCIPTRVVRAIALELERVRDIRAPGVRGAGDANAVDVVVPVAVEREPDLTGRRLRNLSEIEHFVVQRGERAAK